MAAGEPPSIDRRPAIDAGDPAIATAPATDQRGSARVANVIDIGAVELDAGVIDVSPVTVSVAEAAGSVAITLTRSGGTEGAVSVQVDTADGPAIAGDDFTAVSQLVTWADGEGGAQVIDVPIVADDAAPPTMPHRRLRRRRRRWPSRFRPRAPTRPPVRSPGSQLHSSPWVPASPVRPGDCAPSADARRVPLSGGSWRRRWLRAYVGAFRAHFRWQDGWEE